MVDGAVFKTRLTAQRPRRTGILSIENRSYFIIFEKFFKFLFVMCKLDAGDCWCEELLSFLVMCNIKSPRTVLHI